MTLLKVLISRVLGLCCRGLRFRNICKLCYLKNVCTMYVAFIVHFQVIILDFDKQGKVEAATFVVGFSFSNSIF